MDGRPQNECDNCGYTWYPRGKDVSLRCPSCKSADVGIVRPPDVPQPPPPGGESPPASRPKPAALVGVALVAIVCWCGVGGVILRATGVLPKDPPKMAVRATPAVAGVGPELRDRHPGPMPKLASGPKLANQPASVPIAVPAPGEPEQPVRPPPAHAQAVVPDSVPEEEEEVAVAPPPRRRMKPGTGLLRLTTPAPVNAGVEAWVAVDGSKVADWKPGTTEVELMLQPGRRYVVVIVETRAGRRSPYKAFHQIVAGETAEAAVDPK